MKHTSFKFILHNFDYHIKTTTMKLLFSQSIFILILNAFTFCQSASAQGSLPYTTEQFAYDSILNVTYGTATDYAGNNVNLLLDIYKPKGDNNCNRPVIVLVHGGAWVAGSKEDPDLILLSREFAKRGWVVANINYRLGTHKTSNYTMYALCNASLATPCGYICDSSEVYRANFRAMQDTKGAIRFMKNRFSLDSTDVNNVFVAGESAGAFNALSVAFLTNESEKPINCGAISAAPAPDADMNSYGCIPSPNDLSRPDLGSVEGTLNLGIHDASVQGVGSFFGGILDMNTVGTIPENFPVYLFHQGSDIIVHYEYGRALGRLSWECFAQSNICQTFYFYPFASGGKKIGADLTNLGWNSSKLQVEIIDNYEYMNDCFDNGHSIDNLNLRAQNMADLFAAQIEENGNTPSSSCFNSVIENDPAHIELSPNPVSDKLTLHASKSLMNNHFKIISTTGQIIMDGKLLSNEIDVNTLSKGYYFLILDGEINYEISFIKN